MKRYSDEVLERVFMMSEIYANFADAGHSKEIADDYMKALAPLDALYMSRTILNLSKVKLGDLKSMEAIFNEVEERLKVNPEGKLK